MKFELFGLVVSYSLLYQKPLALLRLHKKINVRVINKGAKYAFNI